MEKSLKEQQFFYLHEADSEYANQMKLPRVPLSFIVTGLVMLTFYLLPAAEVSGEARTNFEWFNSLGFPDVKGCPFVRIATGSWGQMGNQPPQNQYLNAFLLASNAANFTSVSLDLYRRTLSYSTNGPPEYKRVGYDQLNLKHEANKLLDAYANGEIKTVTTPDLDERISKRISMFVFAWGCWRNGLNSEAEKLYQLSKTLRYGIAEIDEEHFQLVLEQEIAYAMMWRAVIDFGKTSISRPQLLREFQTIVTNYPHSDQQERARQTVAILQRMIAEDEAHARNAPTNLDVLPVDQRVHELIFQLRDQHGEQGGQPGWCDIFDDWRGVTNSAAHQLVRIGYPAVPQLTAALEDKTFTRSVGFWRDFTFSHTVLTVGDCSAAILERITGVAFYKSGCTSCYMSNEHKEAETRKAAEAWWANFQKNGEKQMLIEGVEVGDESAIAQANLLVARYPDVAAVALTKGIRANEKAVVADAFLSGEMRAAKRRNIRNQLVGIFQKFDPAASRTFLQNELHEGNDGSRVSAAEILVQSNQNDVIKTMIQEWQNSPDYKVEKDQGWTECARFLATVDTPEAIAALGQNLQARPLSTRMAIVHIVGEGGTLWGEIRPISKRSASTGDAIEELFVSCLEDTGQQLGDSGPRLGRHYQNVRICDMAGYYLNQLWPDRYEFYLSDELTWRDYRRMKCMNVWRLNHGQPALPLPTSK
jgi:hypothetical protein